MAEMQPGETVPPQKSTPHRSGVRRLLAACGVVGSCVFLLNLSFGVVEIPDNLPFIGNVDEVVATGFLLACLRYLGLDVLPFAKRGSHDKEGE